MPSQASVLSRGLLPNTDTHLSEKYRRLTLIDPTNTESDSHVAGFTVTCFGKRVKDCLPDPEKGDILVMRDLFVSRTLPLCDQ